MANVIKTSSLTQESKSKMFKTGLVSSAAPLAVGILGLIVCALADISSMTTLCGILVVLGIFILGFHFYQSSLFLRTTVTVTDEGISGVYVSAIFPIKAIEFSYTYSQLEAVNAPKPLGLIIRSEGKIFVVYTEEAQEIAKLILEEKEKVAA